MYLFWLLLSLLINVHQSIKEKSKHVEYFPILKQSVGENIKPIKSSRTEINALSPNGKAHSENNLMAKAEEYEPIIYPVTIGPFDPKATELTPDEFKKIQRAIVFDDDISSLFRKHEEYQDFLERSKKKSAKNLTEPVDTDNIVFEGSTGATVKADFPHTRKYKFNHTRLTCIYCTNVDKEECSEPVNKFLPLTTCANEGDVCYSQHTPFGVVNRGCFNIKRNLTTYVCSCNLCNYVPMVEMPLLFSKRQDWANNVVELSRTKHFRGSVYKKMSCLDCQANSTAETGGIASDTHCFNGDVANVSSKECAPDEICAVKVLHSKGYVWRGCIKYPLYNYWWSFCDHANCNYDKIVSLYDN